MRTTSASTAPPRPGLKLLQVQAAFRHGARTPFHSLGQDVGWSREEYAMPKAGMCEIDCHRPFSRQPLQPAALFAATLLGRDALDGVLIGGALPGILTTAGRREAFELGGALRARYVGNGDAKLLPDTWEKARRLVSFLQTRFERAESNGGTFQEFSR